MENVLNLFLTKSHYLVDFLVPWGAVSSQKGKKVFYLNNLKVNISL
jgi:hypothetical protein